MSSASVDAEAYSHDLFRLIGHVILNDWLWRAFGFRRCPRRGRMWDRFVSPSRLADERFLSREFAVLGFVGVVRCLSRVDLGGYRLPLLARVYELLVTGPGKDVFLFAEAKDSAEYFLVGLKTYLPADRTSQASLFLDRAPTHTEPAVRAKWLVGAVAIFNMSESPLPWITLSIKETLKGTTFIGHPKLGQRAFADLMRLTLRETGALEDE